MYVAQASSAAAPWAVAVPSALRERIARFFEIAEASQIKQTGEHGDLLAGYKAGWTRFLAAPETTALPAVAVTDPKPGVKYSFYEERWIKLPGFPTLTPAAQGAADGITLDVSPVEMSFALRFTGYFKAPETGLYCFTLISNDPKNGS